MVLYHHKEPLTQCGAGQQVLPPVIVFQVDLTILTTKETAQHVCFDTRVWCQMGHQSNAVYSLFFFQLAPVKIPVGYTECIPETLLAPWHFWFIKDELLYGLENRGGKLQSWWRPQLNILHIHIVLYVLNQWATATASVLRVALYKTDLLDVYAKMHVVRVLIRNVTLWSQQIRPSIFIF